MKARALKLSIVFSSMLILCGILQNTWAQSKQLLVISKHHEFSTPGQKDLFQLEVKGSDLLHAEVFFTITSSGNRSIYNISFHSIDLINPDLPAGIDAPKKDQIAFIENRIRTFFDETNFRIPAIAANQEFDEEYSDKQIWDEIKNDKTAIGFYYLLGEEDGRQIAYSKRQKKVVLYFNCC